MAGAALEAELTAQPAADSLSRRMPNVTTLTLVDGVSGLVVTDSTVAGIMGRMCCSSCKRSLQLGCGLVPLSTIETCWFSRLKSLNVKRCGHLSSCGLRMLINAAQVKIAPPLPSSLILFSVSASVPVGFLSCAAFVLFFSCVPYESLSLSLSLSEIGLTFLIFISVPVSLSLF